MRSNFKERSSQIEMHLQKCDVLHTRYKQRSLVHKDYEDFYCVYYNLPVLSQLPSLLVEARII